MRAKKEISVEIKPKKSVLFVSSEVNPFAGTGGLADVMGALPKAIAANGEYDVKVVMPLYSCIDGELRKQFKFLFNINVPLSWRNQYLGIFSYKQDNVTYLFLDNEYYFKRDNGLYGYYDDGERFAFFSKAVLEMLVPLDYYPDVIHVQDHQCAAVIIYLKTLYAQKQRYRDIKSVFTIHNIEYQGKYGYECIADLFGFPEYCKSRIEFDGCINLVKGAIEYCDRFTTVSPTYAHELENSFFAHSLESIITRNVGKFCGILNGVDTDLYNPQTDPKIFKSYSASAPAGKAVCKRELQTMLTLPVRDDVPLVAVISRLVAHKGLDLIERVLEEFLQRDVQVVILGKGEKSYESYFEYIAGRYPGKFRAIIAFNRDMASKLYSGADIFLMPSRQEPCGLSQMIACRYGAIPVVRRTGGLNDTIVSVRNDENGYGYVFDNYNAHEMLFALNDAVNAYSDKAFWSGLRHRAMKADFSWDKSAKEYAALYDGLLG